jgi:hypothetical protein
VAAGADLGAGRESFRRKAWADALAQLSSADCESALGSDDLERLAVAAYLLGMDSDSAQARARAFHLMEDRGETQRAARCTFWLAFELMNTDEMARAGGWLAQQAANLASVLLRRDRSGLRTHDDGTGPGGCCMCGLADRAGLREGKRCLLPSATALAP